MPASSSDAYLELSSDATVREISPGAEQLYGVEAAQVLGKPIGDLLLTDAGRIDWGEHWRAMLAGHALDQVMLHRSASGLRVWVRARLDAHPGGGARLSVRPASGREALEQQPGGLTRALGQKLALGGVGLWMDDRVTDEFDWSELARALHDIAPDAELTPQLLFGQIHPDDRGRAAAAIQRGIAERLPFNEVLRIQHGEHGYRHLHVFGGSTYDAAGLALLSMGGARDVSEELALRRRVKELEDQLRAAQRGDVVGRLAGGIAHDFNNILTGILGCCEMLKDKLRAGEDQRDLEHIRSATLRAADLTRQLLAFGRRQALQRRAVTPEAVLNDVIGLLRRTLPENVEIRVDAGPCRGRVLVDVTQLHQVLTNLVVNAAQAMPEGGRIEIGAARLRLPESLGGSADGADYIRFAVEDSGPGVPADLRSRIFEPFFTTKPPGLGSGLGLSVVQGIVEQHQGRIRLGSGTLGGARFEVYLPATDQAPEGSGDSSQRLAEKPSAVPLRVMLVEDEKMVRELTKRILVGAGFQVIEAADAEEALPMIERGRSFDVLLTDVVLRAMSGPEMVRRLREQGFDLAVVYMSGYPADFVESRVQLGEADVLVHKPFTAATLIAALRQRAAIASG